MLELCILRIRPRTDVDPPRSAGHIVLPRDNFLGLGVGLRVSG